MKYERITLTLIPPVATLTLNSPPLNIIDIAMMDEIRCALGEIRSRREIRALVVTGAGEKAFSAGVEIKEHTPELVQRMLVTFHNIFRDLIAIEIPTIARVRGHCLGGGWELAAVCDYVIATDSATFALPEIKLGCYPPVAAALFPLVTYPKHAERLIQTGETIDATRARELGLVTHLAPAAELDSTTAQVVEVVTGNSAAVARLLRRVSDSWRAEFLRRLDIAERAYLGELTQLPDMTEGVAAFLEKRPPRWSHW